MNKNSERHLKQVQISMTLVKWLVIVTLILLPFSFREGIADWRYLAVAPFAGLAWIFLLIRFWRSESVLVGGAAFLIIIGAYHLSGTGYVAEPPLGHFMQWLASFLLAAILPLFVFQARISIFCNLQKPDS